MRGNRFKTETILMVIFPFLIALICSSSYSCWTPLRGQRDAFGRYAGKVCSATAGFERHRAHPQRLYLWKAQGDPMDIVLRKYEERIDVVESR
jgi:hypothetical protein